MALKNSQIRVCPAAKETKRFIILQFENASKNGYCYLWNEASGNKGAIEIASRVYQLYNVSVCNRHIPKGRVHPHKYFVVTDMQNAGDSMHSCIEKQKNRALKSGPVYAPTQWTGIVQCSKKTGTPYHTLSAEMGSNFTVYENGGVVKWNDIRVLQVKKDHKYILFYKTDFECHAFKTITLRRRRRERPLSENFSLTPAYNTRPCISSEKKKDLLSLCCDGIIPSVYHEFYQFLPTVQAKRSNIPNENTL
ncbi:hypothetical protein PR048_006814 [Dryococelus australis]|uniref:Uncharacterized protein n=1 Tax=Dryococelus australis TaxID=614101 RepID=A0ABQ9ID93_9NEOP|nr:hypothetical protein PR048_006814 [Dryococelus australis]